MPRAPTRAATRRRRVAARKTPFSRRPDAEQQLATADSSSSSSGAAPPLLRKLAAKDSAPQDRAWAAAALAGLAPAAGRTGVRTLLRAGAVEALLAGAQDTDPDVAVEALGALRSLLFAAQGVADSAALDDLIRLGGGTILLQRASVVADAAEATVVDKVQPHTAENKLHEHLWRLADQLLTMLALIADAASVAVPIAANAPPSASNSKTAELRREMCASHSPALRLAAVAADPHVPAPPVAVAAALNLMRVLADQSRAAAHMLADGPLARVVPHCAAWVLLASANRAAGASALVDALQDCHAVYRDILPRRIAAERRLATPAGRRVPIDVADEDAVAAEALEKGSMLLVRCASEAASLANVVLAKVPNPTITYVADKSTETYFARLFARNSASIATSAAACLHSVLTNAIDPVRLAKISRDGGESHKRGKRCNVISPHERVLKRMLPLMAGTLPTIVMDDSEGSSLSMRLAAVRTSLSQQNALDGATDEQQKDQKDKDSISEMGLLAQVDTEMQTEQLAFEVLADIVADFAGWLQVDFTEWNADNTVMKQKTRRTPTATRDDMEGDEGMDIDGGNGSSEDSDMFEDTDDDQEEGEDNQATGAMDVEAGDEFDVSRFEAVHGAEFSGTDASSMAIAKKQRGSKKGDQQQQQISAEEIAAIREKRREERIRDNDCQQAFVGSLARCLTRAMDIIQPIALGGESKESITSDNATTLQFLQSSALHESLQLQLRAAGMANNALSTLPASTLVASTVGSNISDGANVFVSKFWHSILSCCMHLVEWVQAGPEGILKGVTLPEDEEHRNALNESIKHVMETRLEILSELLSILVGMLNNFNVVTTIPQTFDIQEMEAVFLLRLLSNCINISTQATKSGASQNETLLEIAGKTINVLGLLSRIDRADLLEFNRQVGNTLISLGEACQEIDLSISVEALDTLYDIYSDAAFKYDEPVFVKEKMLNRLRAIVTPLRKVIRLVDRRLQPEQRERADVTLINLRAFIKYKESERK